MLFHFVNSQKSSTFAAQLRDESTEASVLLRQIRHLYVAKRKFLKKSAEKIKKSSQNRRKYLRISKKICNFAANYSVM